VDGVILADKPAGASSHDVVARVRRALGIKRVGHAGTLDPFATGLLLVLVGRATRAQRFFMAQRKTYVARARFGWLSTTGDPEGELVETGRVPEEPLVLPTGTLRQRPPIYSAIKVGGRRAYDLARAGEAVDVPEREVQVHRFDRLGPDRFEIECGSGTYVRSLIADLGDAYCTELRRTRIGPFRVEDASLDRVVGLGDALAQILPAVDVEGDLARRLAFGQTVPLDVGEGTVLARDTDGPVALIERRETGWARPVVGFRGT
jgi:tRNA pseudouridine55 synthase